MVISIFARSSKAGSTWRSQSSLGSDATTHLSFIETAPKAVGGVAAVCNDLGEASIRVATAEVRHGCFISRRARTCEVWLCRLSLANGWKVEVELTSLWSLWDQSFLNLIICIFPEITLASSFACSFSARSWCNSKLQVPAVHSSSGSCSAKQRVNKQSRQKASASFSQHCKSIESRKQKGRALNTINLKHRLSMWLPDCILKTPDMASLELKQPWDRSHDFLDASASVTKVYNHVAAAKNERRQLQKQRIRQLLVVVA